MHFVCVSLRKKGVTASGTTAYTRRHLEDVMTNSIRVSPDPPPERNASAPRYTRRLSDKLLLVFHSACDQGRLDVAESVLDLAEQVVRRDPPPLQPERRRQDMVAIVQAYERLWELRNPGRPSRGAPPVDGTGFRQDA
jgi:hypothetical protein